MSILCFLGRHHWLRQLGQVRLAMAPATVSVSFTATCQRCGRTEERTITA